jgi:hypothetical protein
VGTTSAVELITAPNPHKFPVAIVISSIAECNPPVAANKSTMLWRNFGFSLLIISLRSRGVETHLGPYG